MEAEGSEQKANSEVKVEAAINLDQHSSSVNYLGGSPNSSGGGRRH